jgi:hypothetical protein
MKLCRDQVPALLVNYAPTFHAAYVVIAIEPQVLSVAIVCLATLFVSLKLQARSCAEYSLCTTPTIASKLDMLTAVPGDKSSPFHVVAHE